MSFKEAKIALVFDWMTTYGGAEKVNLQLHKIFPEAEIFTSIYNPKKFKGLENATVHTSFINKLPFAKSKHQFYLGLMPYAYELFDLSKFDIVISSSHCCAKGIITKPETLHLCYCHSPMRYAWDNWHQYISEYKMNPIIKEIGKRKMHKLRIWDRMSADRVDHFIANSSTTQRRIKKYYGRDSEIIHPAINTKKYKSSKETEGYFLAVGRLTTYKKFDLIVETFNKIGLPLKIVGSGICKEELQKQAKGNIEFLGFVEDEELKDLYANCEALIFPQLEDFGITPLEAMASGRPVIAYNKGGALDTITEQTGVFFEEQSSQSLIKAIEEFQKRKFNHHNIREHASHFDQSNFKKQLLQTVREKWNKHPR